MLQLSKEIDCHPSPRTISIENSKKTMKTIWLHKFIGLFFIPADGQSKSAQQLISTVLPFHPLYFSCVIPKLLFFTQTLIKWWWWPSTWWWWLLWWRWEQVERKWIVTSTQLSHAKRSAAQPSARTSIGAHCSDNTDIVKLAKRTIMLLNINSPSPPRCAHWPGAVKSQNPNVIGRDLICSKE